MSLLPTESLDELLGKVVASKEWSQAQADFNSSEVVYVIGNGGNLAVADHGAVDITRLSKKLAIAPGSGILATSIIGDSSFNDWFTNWLSANIQPASAVKNKGMVIGISSSGTASNIVKCLSHANEQGMKTLMISARNITVFEGINTVCIGTDYYHTGEVISLMLFYQLVHGSGCSCPSISQKLNEPSFDRLVHP